MRVLPVSLPEPALPARLAAALLAACPTRPDWERLLLVGLSTPLDTIAPPGDLRAVAGAVLRWADTQGRVTDLLAAAIDDNPDNATLRAAAAAWAQQPPGTRLFAAGERPGAAVPRMGPRLPDSFVPRPTEYAALRAAVCGGTGGLAAITTAALRGAGGFGKTTLAAQLCADPAVQAAFPAGTLWVTVGDRPADPTAALNEWIWLLSGRRSAATTWPGAQAALAPLLAGQRVLIVVDDVWSRAALEPFLVGAPPVVHLVSTRDPAALPPGTPVVVVDAMQAGEAAALLAAGLPGTAPAPLARLAARLGEWPLLLGLVNRVLHERVRGQGQALALALEYVERALDQRGLSAFDVRDAARREEAVAATIGISLTHLAPDEQARCRELGLFPEDVDVPLATVGQLWAATAGLDDLATEELAGRLWRLGLLLRFDLQANVLRLHDVVRAHLLSALGAGAAALHGRLLDAWGDPRAWSPADGYAWRWLGYHLLAAGRAAEWRARRLDYRWIAGKLAATGVAGLLADYRADAADPALGRVLGALRLAGPVLAATPGQLGSQLWGRLAETEAPEIGRLLETARREQGGRWLRPRTASLTPPGAGLLSRLEGHTGRVQAVAVTPDGQRAVSASNDQTLRVWDLATGARRATLAGHTGGVRAVAVTPDGQRAISASRDQTLRIWDLGMGRARPTRAGHTRGVSAVAVTPDGQRAVSASNDHTLRVWDLGTGQALHTLAGHTREVTAVGVTPDGQRAVSVSWDRTLRVWDLGTGQTLHTLAGHTGGVRAVAVTPDGQRAVSASQDGTLRVWDLTSGQALHTLAGHTAAVRAVAVTPDGQCAVSASQDGTLRVWDLGTGQVLHTLAGYTGPVTAVAVTPDGQRVVSAADDHTPRVWDLGTGPPRPTRAGHTAVVYAVAVTPNGQRAVSASWDQTLRVWDLATGQALHTLRGHTAGVRAVGVTPDGQCAVSASNDHTLRVWDLGTGQA
ncbi:MAG TPA: effector-associated domain EAD1-containing protein, partial [Chloroflexia bacterium]|nr:effector-associated domain EAD1-containing protein [Chloroflexia bacterium]